MLSYKDTKLKRRKRGRQDRYKQTYIVSRQGASFGRANRRSAEYGRIWQVTCGSAITRGSSSTSRVIGLPFKGYSRLI